MISLLASHNVVSSVALPPESMVMPADWQLYVTVAFGIAALISWFYALRMALSTRDALPVFVMLGGTACVLAEAPVDILGMCYWPEIGQWSVYETFGRQIPLTAAFAYMTFYGGVVLASLQQFRSGATYVQICKWFCFWMVMEFTWEPIPIMNGVWTYYGAQPFRLFEFPLWWPPVNTVGAYSAAFLLFKLLPHLKGAARLLVIPAVVSGDLAGNAVVAWPIWSALNSSAGYAATVPAGLLTLVLCACALHFIATNVAGTERSRVVEPRKRAALA